MIRRLSIVIMLCVMLLPGCSRNSGDESSPVSTDSQIIEQSINLWLFADFLEELQGLDYAAQMALADSFMLNADSLGIPLREGDLAHFLYRGNPNFPFSLAGDMNGWTPNVDGFSQAGLTDLFYVSRNYPADARLDYKFVLGSNWILDPLNPYQVLSGFGPNSELRMPAYVAPWEIAYDAEIAHGTLEVFSFSSNILNNSRTVKVYLPPGYETSDFDYPTIYVQDGSEYVSLGSMVNVLDNLIAADKILPVIAVFVDPVDRNSEYWLNDNYVTMLTDELLPYIDENYRCIDAADQRGIMGASLGGLISLYASYLHPEIFGLSASHSGAFWVNNNQIVDLYEAAPHQSLKIYLDWGTFEQSIAESNYLMRDALQGDGYDLEALEFHEGHSWGSWRAHIDNILILFWSTNSTGIH